MTWVRQCVAIVHKEWRAELRTRHAVMAVLLFAVTTLVTISLALGPAGVSSPERATVLPVLLWILLLFAVATGLPRTFGQEEETHTATALRLAVLPSALYAGKSLYSLSLVVVVEALVTPLFLALTSLTVPHPGRLVAALGLGAVGLAVVSTLIAAMVAQAPNRGALFPVLAFPVLLPLLLLAVELTRSAVTGEPAPMVASQLLLYDGALATAGLMLFPPVWNP